MPGFQKQHSVLLMEEGMYTGSFAVPPSLYAHWQETVKDALGCALLGQVYQGFK